MYNRNYLILTFKLFFPFKRAIDSKTNLYNKENSIVSKSRVSIIPNLSTTIKKMNEQK